MERKGKKEGRLGLGLGKNSDGGADKQPGVLP